MANKFIFGIAVFWTFLIAVLCLAELNKLPNMPSFGIFGMDKWVHSTFHFGFTMLWSTYFWKTQKELFIKTVLIVFLFSVTYGILIEFLQNTFTTTRKADVLDVLANTTGAAVAIIVLLCYKHFSKNKN